jgi:hypothetical protein
MGVTPPPAGAFAAQHEILTALVNHGPRHDTAVRHLQAYFRPDLHGDPPLTGRHFDDLAGGGTADPNRITPADLLSLATLSISSRHLSNFSVAVLAKEEQTTRLLREVPTTAIYETEYDKAFRAAQELWDLLRTCGGQHLAVSATKLLARKRPHLLPIVDAHIQAALLNLKTGYWDCYWTWFDAVPSRVSCVRQLRAAAGVPSTVSLLRCLDVALWMPARESHPHPEAA